MGYRLERHLTNNLFDFLFLFLLNNQPHERINFTVIIIEIHHNQAINTDFVLSITNVINVNEQNIVLVVLHNIECNLNY